VGIADTDLSAAEARLAAWVERGWHGEMDYMARHGARRARPAELVPGTACVITARLNYTPADARESEAVLADPGLAFVSRYALGRDYHKVMRAKLQRLAERMTAELGEFPYRVFTDSAPVMEVALAAHAGLGWRGKHTLLLSRDAGSMFFLGEIFVGLDLARDAPVTEHCGTCSRCIDVCPTQAIVAPYQLDARRCISYLTIEHHGATPDDGQPHLRLRRLPARMPVEQMGEGGRGARLRRAQRARCRDARRPVRLDGAGIRTAAGGQRDPPHRPRALAAQHRRGTR
jgi:epoxyqueuosine reductase